MTTRTIRKATLEELNAIANRPDVLQNLGGTLGKTEDLSQVDGWDRMVPLTAGDGCMLFLEEEPGCWRTDLLFVPGSRNNLRDARAMVTHIFEEYSALGVYGFTPRWNARACRFVEALPGTLVHYDPVMDENLYATRRDTWPWLTKREHQPK